MVSLVHSGLEGEDIEQTRRQPRLNKTNKNNVVDVWGKEYKKKISITVIINDYNYWMNGVDVADELNSNYRPKL